MRFNVKALLVLGLTLALGLGAAQQAVTLNMWSWRPEDDAVYKEIIARFEQQNPGIRVQFTPYRNVEYNTILATALQAGTGPDIIQTRAYGGLAQFADAGFLLPLDGLVPRLAQFNRDVLIAATSLADGKIYGVPFATQTLGIFYNADLLERHNVPVPRTRDEFKVSLVNLKARGVTPLANGGADGWTLEVMFGVLGPPVYGGTTFFDATRSGERTFEDSAFIRALEEMKTYADWMPRNFMGVGYEDMRQLFLAGRAAYFIGGSFEIGYFRAQNPNLRFGFMPTPPARVGETPVATTFADGNWSINARTRHRDAALRFINYTASVEFGQAFTDRLAQISPVPGVVPADRLLAQIVEWNKNSTPYLMLVGYRWQTPTGSTLLQSGLQELMSGAATPEKVANDVQRGIATWHRPFQR
jgi:raffinose/stachyose/melibiose transport system substrate-binding protein